MTTTQANNLALRFAIESAIPYTSLYSIGYAPKRSYRQRLQFRLAGKQYQRASKVWPITGAANTSQRGS